MSTTAREPKHDGPTASFRHVRLELAREKGHPEGDRHQGYDLVVPLDASGHLDPVEWKAHQAACRVRRFHEHEADQIGRLRRKPGGTWYFDYVEGRDDDEIGFRFGAERFVPGEYVSISHRGVMHTYQIKRVQEL
ncbi:hypothetical protein [Jiella sp. M17.18]|uniref:hypothetical protein n=1 Tax=Jiella sp. M17.18 TaxID=3234247 RepID=UPI0034DDF068